LEYDAVRRNRARSEFRRRLPGWVRDIDETIVSFAYYDELIFDHCAALDRATNAEHAAGARRGPLLFDNALAGLRFPAAREPRDLIDATRCFSTGKSASHQHEREHGDSHGYFARLCLRVLRVLAATVKGPSHDASVGGLGCRG